MAALGQSRRFWRVWHMSAYGVISEVRPPGLPVENIDLDVIQASKPEARILQ
jgi:hypothetical protein